MKTPFAIRLAIYSLDPNRHLSANVPFHEYFVNLLQRAVEGIPVPEQNIKLFRSVVQSATEA